MIVKIILQFLVLYILLSIFIIHVDYLPIKPQDNYRVYKNDNLKILCWNIKLLPSPFYNNVKHINKIVDVIRFHDPDIICIQECFSSITYNKRHLLKKFPDYNYVIPPKFFSFPRMTCSGLVILSKYNIVDHDSITFKFCKLEDCLSNKGMLLAKIGDVWILNVHLQNDDIKTVVQFLQIKQIKKYIDNLRKKHPKDKIILVGDFNVDIKQHDNLSKIKNVYGDSSINILSTNKLKTFGDNKYFDLVLSNVHKNKLDIKISKNPYPSDHHYLVVKYNRNETI